MPPSSAFDIYQTASGHVAVTSEVRRAILAALAEGPRRLPDLAEATGKSKPTLSSLHVRELLDQRLIEEVADPKDARTKWYRLVATKIGSSDVPVEALRDAVKRYVTTSPFAARLTLAAAFDALFAGDASDRVLRAQARRLGSNAASLFPARDAASLLAAFAQVVERERLATVHENAPGRLALRLPASAATDAGRVGALWASFLEGAAEALGFPLTLVAKASSGRIVLAAPP